jgi:2-iminobutanoate/2-iminopropanoate deaminase
MSSTRPTYAEAFATINAERTLYISGQVPTNPDGTVPAEFEAQAHNSWARIVRLLEQHDMDVTNLVKITTFLRDRSDRDENRRVRTAVLGSHLPALTVIVTGLFEEDWRIEIEAIAVS